MNQTVISDASLMVGDTSVAVDDEHECNGVYYATVGSSVFSGR